MYIADWYTYCIIYGGACLYKSYDMNELHFQRIITNDSINAEFLHLRVHRPKSA